MIKIIEVNNYDELSNRAGNIIIDAVKNNPKTTLGLATGATPLGLYKNLIKDHRENKTSYKDVKSFNLDEYIGLSREHSQSYYHFMNKHLFNHLDINKKNTFIPNGLAKDLSQECGNYNGLLQKNTIDIQILGIGTNGHIGFNEPGTSFDSKVHVIELNEITRKDNARFFNSMDQVPTRAITMGIANIMNAKMILLLVSGENKSRVLDKMLNGHISEDIPASILQKHPHVIVIGDEGAMKFLR